MISRTKLLPLVLAFECARSALVVTIGDSYGAGDGVHALRKDYDDTYCYVEKDTTPGGKYATTRGLQHIVPACTGADIVDTVAQWDDLQLRYTDEAWDLWEGSVILVATGANSPRSKRGDKFATGLKRCLAVPRCHEDKDNQVVNFDQVQDELEALYSILAAEAEKATVRVMGYPKNFNSNRLRCSVPGISVHEAAFFDKLVVEMNDRIVAAVATVQADSPNFDIRYVDVTKQYTNGACFPSDSARSITSIHAFQIPVFIPLRMDTTSHTELFWIQY